MGGRNRCIGLAPVLFSIYLNMHRSCTVAKTHTVYVYGCLRALVPLGGVPLPHAGLPELSDPNTLFGVAVAHFSLKK